MKIPKVMLASSTLLLLGACASLPSGPSVMAMPGSGKSYQEFRIDDEQCRQYAARQMSGSPNDAAITGAVVGTAVGAAAGAALGGHEGAGAGAGIGLLFGSTAGAGAAQGSAYSAQRQYDNVYIQCMYGQGQKVPVPAGMLRERTAPAGDQPPRGNYPPPPPAYAPPPPPQYAPPPPPR